MLTSDHEMAESPRSQGLPTTLYAGADRATRRSGGWHAAFDYATPSPQVAAFALAPRARGTWLWDLGSVAALAGVVAACGWGLGWLTL